MFIYIVWMRFRGCAGSMLRLHFSHVADSWQSEASAHLVSTVVSWLRHTAVYGVFFWTHKFYEHFHRTNIFWSLFLNSHKLLLELLLTSVHCSCIFRPFLMSLDVIEHVFPWPWQTSRWGTLLLRQHRGQPPCLQRWSGDPRQAERWRLDPPRVINCIALYMIYQVYIIYIYIYIQMLSVWYIYLLTYI